MKKGQILCWVACFVLLLISGVQAASDPGDCKGCKDHPLFTRMPDFRLSIYRSKEFEQHKFQTESGKYISVEGAYYFLEYDVNRNVKHPSELQIIRNHTNAIEKIGGKLLREASSHAYYVIKKDGMETWVYLDPANQGKMYRLTIIEKQAMAQDVVATAAQMTQDIRTTGHVAVYGIYFDFNKADLKPESEPTLNEIAKFLAQNPGLKVFVVGHTDNVGKVDFNMKLSQARADAVQKALTSRYKVSPQRMEAYGVGQLMPVMSNRTEEGRAKNRRVELVEQ